MARVRWDPRLQDLLDYERGFWSRGVFGVAGVDEAGRGPLAGPVVAAAVILDLAAIPDGLDDSKLIAIGRRIELFELIVARAQFGVGIASVEEIDRLNILWATMLAMKRAVDALGCRPAHVLVDGDRVPELDCPATAVVRGDLACMSVAAASIVAKVMRDRMMAQLALSHPGYGWEHNAGYGTPEHLHALARFGATAHHRRSFRPVAEALGLMALPPARGGSPSASSSAAPGRRTPRGDANGLPRRRS